MMLTKPCRHCGSEFAKKASHSASAWKIVKYCSKACYTAAQKGHDALGANRYAGTPHNKGKPGPRGEDSPSWRGGEVGVICRHCGSGFSVRPHRATVAKFCSKRCSERARDEGKSTEQRRIRESAAYAAWRKSVFDRDDYTCVMCGKRGGHLHADHIKPFASYPELRLDINNGRTLCVECHKETPTYGNRRVFVVASAQEA